MKLLFCHGLEGSPDARKVTALRAGIRRPENGFVALVRKDPSPTAQVCLERVREEAGGNVYRWPEAERASGQRAVWYSTGRVARHTQGWLCPALFRYFDRAPERLYVEVRANDSG